MKRFIFFCSLCFPFITVILLVVQLVVSNNLAGMGQETQSIDRKINEISLENEKMAKDIAEQSSLRAIENRAYEIGYTVGSNTITIGNEPVAFGVR